MGRNLNRLKTLLLFLSLLSFIPPSGEGSHAKKTAARKCSICGQSGHQAPLCPQRQAVSLSGPPLQPEADESDDVMHHDHDQGLPAAQNCLLLPQQCPCNDDDDDGEWQRDDAMDDEEDFDLEITGVREGVEADVVLIPPPSKKAKVSPPFTINIILYISELDPLFICPS